MGCHFLLQGIFPTQGSNLRLLYWQANSLPLSHLRSLKLTCCSVALVVQLFATPWIPPHQASLLHCFPEFAQTHVHWSMMPSNHLILCRPLLLLPSIFPSIRVFSSELAFGSRWPEYWSFSISPSNEYSGLISFRTDYFDLLAVQQTLKSLLQHHNLKTPILGPSTFFMVQLSHLDKQIWKNHSFDYTDLCQQSGASAF